MKVNLNIELSESEAIALVKFARDPLAVDYDEIRLARDALKKVGTEIEKQGYAPR